MAESKNIGDLTLHELLCSQELMNELSSLLDPVRDDGNDHNLLLKKLGFQAVQITYFKDKNQPTREALCRKAWKVTLYELVSHLDDMHRADCIAAAKGVLIRHLLDGKKTGLEDILDLESTAIAYQKNADITG
ncbi:uncharacterized protein LOC144447797 [Glandiceps talaboti]